LAVPAAASSAVETVPATTRVVATMFGLVSRSACQRIESSSSESSTTSAESALVITMTARGPNSPFTSPAGSTGAPSSVTTSKSTSERSCHVPALTEPNTATARIRSSCR
jgi:hypothetical protein